MAILVIDALPDGPTPHTMPAPTIATDCAVSFATQKSGREPCHCPLRQPHRLYCRLPPIVVRRGAEDAVAAARVLTVARGAERLYKTFLTTIIKKQKEYIIKSVEQQINFYIGVLASPTRKCTLILYFKG
jgi:hypothetical protein